MSKQVIKPFEAWTVVFHEDDNYVLPSYEERYHTLVGCICKPKRMLTNDGKILHVHQSFDGRELLEEVEVQNLFRIHQRYYS